MNVYTNLTTLDLPPPPLKTLVMMMSGCWGGESTVVRAWQFSDRRQILHNVHVRKAWQLSLALGHAVCIYWRVPFSGESIHL
jgi:hypothetical protein